MKAIFICILILAIAFCFVGCNSRFEKDIIVAACNELDVDCSGATIKYLSSEEIPWSDEVASCYVLTVQGEKYLVGVKSIGCNITFVDVEDYYCE